MERVGLNYTYCMQLLLAPGHRGLGGAQCAPVSVCSSWGAGRFEVELGALQVFANDERTRSFLALGAVAGTAEVRGHAAGKGVNGRMSGQFISVW